MTLIHRLALASVLTTTAVCATPAHAAATFFFTGTPYLSTGNIPAGFYASGVPDFLETFEDGSLDGNLSTSAGQILVPGLFNGFRDSVDLDDGVADGSGQAGSSLFVGSGPGGTLITFGGANLPTAFGVVWTDGDGDVTFIARDGAGLQVLNVVVPAFADSSFLGTTAEDRFFGVTSPGGIRSLFIGNASGGMEIDHIQYGQMVAPAAVPVPAPAWLLMSAVAALVGRRRRVT